MTIDTFTWSEDGMDRNELMTYVQTPFSYAIATQAQVEMRLFSPDFEINFVGFVAQDLCLEPNIPKL